eukprot:TRINITY_DN23124_c0_g1_i1.p1 TRINITY_DN23124_c0_g1~~TRINITY_DN23124_c0_g1_i1.p1  ORF type:complete len:147 (+),score=36.64 TRINITY_DN23124_c0_g1_i1:84-524(+)
MPANTGRREHLDDAQFVKELEKLYSLGRTEAAGNVAISFSKIPQKWIKAKVADKKNKKKSTGVSGVMEKPHAIVRAKRQGKTISCVVGEEDLLRFQSNLAACLKSNIDTLRKADKISKKEKKAKKKAAKAAAAAAAKEAEKETAQE